MATARGGAELTDKIKRVRTVYPAGLPPSSPKMGPQVPSVKCKMQVPMPRPFTEPQPRAKAGTALINYHHQLPTAVANFHKQPASTSS